jgi:hypothetical protein
MTVTATPIFPQTIKGIGKRIITSDSTNLVTLFTAGENGAIVRHLQACSDDLSQKVLQIWKTSGGVDTLIMTVLVTTNAGSNGSTAPALITNNTTMSALPYDANGNRIIELQAGDILKAKVTTAMTSARIMHITGSAGDF